MADYGSVRSDWWELLNWHLKINGTRPTGTPQTRGPLWTEKDFAKACNVGDPKLPERGTRTVYGWVDRSKKQIPSSSYFNVIEKALFGQSPDYAVWIADLRTAFKLAKEAKSKSSKADAAAEPRAHDEFAMRPNQEQIPQLILDDLRAEGRHLKDTALYTDSVIAKVQRDEFQEREQDIEFLGRFLGGQINAPPKTQQFRWAVVTGSAGQGKTRLAIHFLDVAAAQGFSVGFLPLIRAGQLDARNWRPRCATLIVIDYAAESPSVIAYILREFAATALSSEFGFPVRVLLLEREVTSDWIKTISPEDSVGANVRAFCYTENPKGVEHRLSALSPKALLSIMRGRIPSGIPPNAALLETLTRVDPQRRPLFAVGIAQAIANKISEGEDPSAIIAKLCPADVFSILIERARAHFWSRKAIDSHTEKRRLDLHENLLVVATIALDLPRGEFEDECPLSARTYLPDSETLDVDRYRSMAGGDPLRVFNRLEPDLFGEFFVMDRLKNKVSAGERQALIDAAFSLGGGRAATFLVRCAIDFGEEWRSVGYLRPSMPGSAARAFAAGVLGLVYAIPEDRIDDASEAISVVAELAQSDRTLRESVAMALVAKEGRLSSNERYGHFRTVVDQFEGAVGPRNYAPDVFLLRASVLERAGLREAAIATYGEFIRRFCKTTEGELKDSIAHALINMGRISKKAMWDEEVEAGFKDVIDSVDDPGNLADSRVWQAFFFKGLTPAEEDDPDEWVVVSEEVVERFRSFNKPLSDRAILSAYIIKLVWLLNPPLNRRKAGQLGELPLESDRQEAGRVIGQLLFYFEKSAAQTLGYNGHIFWTANTTDHIEPDWGNGAAEIFEWLNEAVWRARSPTELHELAAKIWEFRRVLTNTSN